MILLITGVPGAGKTLRTVWYLARWAREGRKVYADIDGLIMPGVEHSPDDWRDTPEGSVVIYDECQRRFPADGSRGRSERDDIAAMETHRHSGHDIVLVTQHPGLIHSHVRRLVGRHEHLERVFGADRARIYWRDRAWAVDQRSERNSAPVESFPYPKDLYSLFRSASMHVSQKKMPFRLKFYFGLIATCVVAAVLLGVYAWRSWSSREPAAAPVVPSSQPLPAPSRVPSGFLSAAPARALPDLRWSDRDWAAASAAAVVVGCVWTDQYCRCYGRDGNPLVLDGTECQRRAGDPLPINVNPRSSSRSPVAADREGKPVAVLVE